MDLHTFFSDANFNHVLLPPSLACHLNLGTWLSLHYTYTAVIISSTQLSFQELSACLQDLLKSLSDVDTW